MRFTKLFLLLFVLSVIGWGQQQTTLTAPPPPALNNLNFTIVGRLGNNTYFYYIVTTYPIGSVVSNGFRVANAPILTASNYVKLNWNAMDGAISYDIIRSTAPNLFTSGSSGSCTNCAVTTGYTSTSYSDTTANLTNPYSLTAPMQASIQISLDNRNHSSPYLNLASVMGPPGIFNIQMPVICVSGCSGSGSVPSGIGVPFSNNGASFTSAANFTGVPKYNGGSPQSNALFGDIVSLWGGAGCTGFLKNDGTCAAGGGITQLTGDITAGPGTGSVPTTLATVNTNIGTCGDSTHVSQVTLNAKGLTTACTPVSIAAGGTPGGSTNDIQWNNAGTFAGGRCTMDSSQNLLCTGSLTGVSFLSGDITHSGLDYLQGKTSGGVALGVDDIAGTAITYVLPSTNGVAGQVLSDNGAIVCPTFAAGGPATCHQLLWVTGVTGIASGTAALGIGAIVSGTCATAITVSATGVATTDTVTASFNGDPTGVIGYQPTTSGMLTIIPYPTLNNVNFKVCNNTASSVTPGAITLNWKVVR